MINIDLNSELKSYAIKTECGINFHPPVYEQRYISVINVLSHKLFEGSIKKVVDFGCGDLSLFPMLKNLDNIEHIVEIDIDEDLLLRCGYRVCPLLSDYLKKRQKSLNVEVYKGSISEPHECLLNTDAVIGLEVIEHVYPDVLEELPYNIFGFMKPKLIILTTPNYEFNVLFGKPSFPNGFRHADHKFEWTRQQFEDWANNLCVRYPDYLVDFYGIGRGPEGTESYGCVTQMAVFIRKDSLCFTDIRIEKINIESSLNKFQTTKSNLNNSNSNSNSVNNNNFNEVSSLSTKFENSQIYKLIFNYNYPQYCDNRTRNEKIIDEAKYHLSRFQNMEEEYYDFDQCAFKIPLHTLLELVLQHTNDIDELRQILISNDYIINSDGDIIIPDEDYGENFDHEDNDNNETNISTNESQSKYVEISSTEEMW